MARRESAQYRLEDGSLLTGSEPGGYVASVEVVVHDDDETDPTWWPHDGAVDTFSLRDEYGRFQWWVEAGRDGLVAERRMKPLGESERQEKMRRRLRSEVDPADVALALVGDVEAVDRVRAVVEGA